MKKASLFILFLLAILSIVKAEEYKGLVKGYIPIKDDEIELQYTSANVYFQWKIYTLYGEPVKVGLAYVTIDNKLPNSKINVIGSQSWSSMGSIPSSVLKKVRVKSVTLKGIFRKPGFAGKVGYYTEIDAGIPGTPYYGTYQSLKSLSKEKRRRYTGFNVPGSPSWSKLFRPMNTYYGDDFISSDKAKEHMKAGIKLEDCGKFNYSSEIKVEWDLSAVKEWLVQQEKAKLDKKLAAVKKRKEELRIKAAIAKQKEADDFWGTPEDTETPKDKADKKKIEQLDPKLLKQEKELMASLSKVAKEKEEIEQYLAAKRNRLKNTPKPGENTGTFVDERDGREYKWGKIGDQVWMAENLAYDMGSGCWAYDNDESNVEISGRLYTWEVATDACPSGWHLPSKDEWIELAKYLANNGYNYDGSKGGSSDKIAKAMAAKFGWDTENEDGDVGFNQQRNNSSGFSSLPGGVLMHDNYLGGDGKWHFTGQNTTAVWWSSSSGNQYYAFHAIIFSSSPRLELRDKGTIYCRKTNGHSVRCIKD